MPRKAKKTDPPIWNYWKEAGRRLSDLPYSRWEHYKHTGFSTPASLTQDMIIALDDILPIWILEKPHGARQEPSLARATLHLNAMKRLPMQIADAVTRRNWVEFYQKIRRFEKGLDRVTHQRYDLGKPESLVRRSIECHVEGILLVFLIYHRLKMLPNRTPIGTPYSVISSRLYAEVILLMAPMVDCLMQYMLDSPASPAEPFRWFERVVAGEYHLRGIINQRLITKRREFDERAALAAKTPKADKAPKHPEAGPIPPPTGSKKRGAASMAPQQAKRQKVDKGKGKAEPEDLSPLPESRLGSSFDAGFAGGDDAAGQSSIAGPSNLADPSGAAGRSSNSSSQGGSPPQDRAPSQDSSPGQGSSLGNTEANEPASRRGRKGNEPLRAKTLSEMAKAEKIKSEGHRAPTPCDRCSNKPKPCFIDPTQGGVTACASCKAMKVRCSLSKKPDKNAGTAKDKATGTADQPAKSVSPDDEAQPQSAEDNGTELG